jgi:hypothetical protein
MGYKVEVDIQDFPNLRCLGIGIYNFRYSRN